MDNWLADLYNYMQIKGLEDKQKDQLGNYYDFFYYYYLNVLR